MPSGALRSGIELGNLRHLGGEQVDKGYDTKNIKLGNTLSEHGIDGAP